MKKSLIIVDLILIILFIILFASNIFKLTNLKIFQPLFMVFLVVHIAQHWKILISMTKRLFKK